MDSATSLIQAAKNLMNAVVLTVKSCYVASTKYPRLSVTSKDGTESKQKVALVWKMKVRVIYTYVREGNQSIKIENSFVYEANRIYNFFYYREYSTKICITC